MKVLKTLIVWTVIVSITSCYDCDSNDAEKTEEYNRYLHRYMQGYKTGSYFIFFDKNLTYKDSFYIDEYISEYTVYGIPGYDGKCTEYPKTEFKIHSSRFDNGNAINVYYIKPGENPLTSLLAYTNNDSQQTGFSIRSLSDSDSILGSDFVETLNPVSSSFPTYENVWKVSETKTIWMAPEVGICQFIGSDNDTMFLHHYYIP